MTALDSQQGLHKSSETHSLHQHSESNTHVTPREHISQPQTPTCEQAPTSTQSTPTRAQSATATQPNQHIPRQCSVEYADTNDHWGYDSGKSFTLAQAQSPQDWLNVALRAERYVAQFQHDDADGIYWEGADSPTPNPGYADGSAGIMYFYLELFRATGDEQYRHIAYRAAHWLLAHWHDQHEQSGTALEGFDSCLGNILLEAYKAFGDETFATAAREFAQGYIDSAVLGSVGPRWSGNTAWAKDGAIILFLLNLGRTLNDSDVLDFVKQAGEQYLSQGVINTDGRLVFDGKLGGTAVWEGIVFRQDYNMPNWEFGAAGSGFIVLKLYELTGDERYLNAARDQLHYLRSVAVPQTKGVLIPRSLDPDPQESDVFYIGHCHGIAGTGKFLYELLRITGDDNAQALINDLADGAESLGAPEHQSKGLWNIVTLCCGHAGLVHYFIGLYLATGNNRWRDLAVRAGNVILGMREDLSDGSTNWPIAFWRVKPTEITRPHTLFRGAAGVGLALIELYMASSGRFTLDRLIDDPFPADWQGNF